MQELAQLIKDAVDNFGDEETLSFRNNYSGRFMFGRECVGIVGSESDCMEIIREVIKDAHAQGMEFDFDSLVDTILDYGRDNMGRDMIFYWPNVQSLPETEPEHDGQPDEAQEWHDFDPDC